MVEKYINEAFASLGDVIPKDWEKIKLHAIINLDYYEIFFYVKCNGEYIQCYDLEDKYQITEDEIDDVFETWYKISIAEKKEEEWQDYTVSIESNGKFAVDYNYDNDFDLFIWKDKYLKD